MKLKNITDWIFTHVVFLNPSIWPYRESFSKVLAVLIIGFLLIAKAKLIKNQVDAEGLDQFWIIWVWELFMLLVYLTAYLVRKPAKNVAHGFWEVVFPIMVALLPIFIVASPTSLVPINYASEIGIFFIVLGAIINFLALFQLRTAFSVMAEARTLVKTGLYRWVRHPIYTGHFILFFGALLWHWHPLTIAAFGVFVFAQTYRAKIEEAKLSESFPEYKKYKKETGMFFPRI